MSNGIFRVRVPNNEPIYGYKPGSKEKLELNRTLSQMKDNVIDGLVTLD